MFGIKRTQLDGLFSFFIRWRDGWTCQVCGKKFDPTSGESRMGLHTAHCFSRSTKQTRWEPLNAAAACFNCHVGPRNDDALDNNVKEKYKWFRNRIGDKAFDMLEFRFRNPGKFKKPDQKLLKIFFKAEIEKMKKAHEGEILGRH
jgi:rubredoxin